jgi:uncharacterized phage protein (TIGR01671 family)
MNTREIKFRIWDLLQNRFIPNADSICLIPQYGIIHGNVKHPSYNIYYNPNLILQQYTGLKDKNGKEIYEGDIICIPENDPTSSSGNALLTVEYRYGGFGYVDVMTKKFENIHYLIGDIDTDDCAEVVGNIFENPELLK